MKRIILLTVVLVLVAVNTYAKDYVIGGGDSLEISVWGNPELSLNVTVRPDGKISIPALGDIMAAGATANELTAILEKELERMVKTPIVTVIVNSMHNYRIYVLGKGAPNGVHVLSMQVTLLEFLSRLGSLEDADFDSAYLVRNKEKIKTDFSSLLDYVDFKNDIVLENNDMLYIPDNFGKRVSIVGAVNNPLVIPFRKGLTMLDVILSAGGFNEFAKQTNVTIVRRTGKGKRKEIVVNAKKLLKGELKENVLIAPGDFIVVKESLF